MRLFKAKYYPFTVLCHNNNDNNDIQIPYPLLRDDLGDVNLYCVSPLHGRSFVLGKNSNGRWIISKGNGLSYSSHRFLNTGITDNYLWGVLPKHNAIRDFEIGIEVGDLGIKTNLMEFVLEINCTINDQITNPCLLQYSVECPYRICDFAFMSKNILHKYLRTWELMNDHNFNNYYLIAANILIRNLRIMHDNGVMHNAINPQNYTWALELVDFEGSRTNKMPYSNKEYESHIANLIQGEIIQTYQVINYIAYCLRESIDFKIVDKLFYQYGFDLNKYH